jgi:serine phosphatase RsbU (regulator of sigma subunit)
MIEGDSPGKEYVLDREVTVIGKAPTCGIVLADAHVSKLHARITQTSEGVFIEDLDSKNHTWVAGCKIKRRALEDGDVIGICDFRLLYFTGSKPTGTTPTILTEIDATTVADRSGSEVRPEEKLRAIMEVVTELTGVLDLDHVLDQVLGALFRILPHAERGFVLFKDADSPEIRVAAMKVQHPGSVGATISRTLYRYVTGEGRAVLCEDIAADSRFRTSESARDLPGRTIMCVPLWDHERRAVGVIQVDTQAGQSRFKREDLDFLVAVAGAVGMAVENARLSELAVRHEQAEQERRDARAVQRALLPEATPALPGYEFWHCYEAARFVGGDYFDYRRLSGSGLPFGSPQSPRWAIALGDVSGKGMPAALMMARLSSEVRLLLQAERDPARVIELLNQDLCDSLWAEQFITLLLLILDGDGHELTIVSAGHMGPMIRRGDGRIEVVGETGGGPVLGVVEGQAYGAETARLGRDDVVVAYTDGVTDALSPAGERFGFTGLQQALAGAPRGAAAVGEAIREAVRRHTAGCEPFDDITLLAFGRP